MSKSPEVLEANFDNLKESMLEDRKINATEHQEIKQLFADGINSLSKKIDDISINKANKWVETVMRIFLVSFGLGVLSFIGYYFWELVRAIERG